MFRWIIQIFLIGFAVYAGYRNRYRLVNAALSNSFLRRFLVKRSMDLPFVRGRMVQNMFSQVK